MVFHRAHLLSNNEDALMYNIKSRFKTKFYDQFKQLGFIRKQNLYIRVVNDVLQNFNLHTRNNHYFNIEFAVLPLCMDISKFGYDISRYNLKNFELFHSLSDVDWKYDSLSISSIDECLDNISIFIDTYLIPFFQSSTNCEKALSNVLKIENLFYENRVKFMLSIGGKYDDSYVSNLNYFDSVIYFLALKAKQYPLALQCRKKQFNSQIDRISCADEIRLLEQNDFSYFNILIDTNEKNSKEYLLKKKIINVI